MRRVVLENQARIFAFLSIGIYIAIHEIALQVNSSVSNLSGYHGTHFVVDIIILLCTFIYSKGLVQIMVLVQLIQLFVDLILSVASYISLQQCRYLRSNNCIQTLPFDYIIFGLQILLSCITVYNLFLLTKLRELPNTTKKSTILQIRVLRAACIPYGIASLISVRQWYAGGHALFDVMLGVFPGKAFTAVIGWLLVFLDILNIAIATNVFDRLCSVVLLLLGLFATVSYQPTTKRTYKNNDKNI